MPTSKRTRPLSPGLRDSNRTSPGRRGAAFSTLLGTAATAAVTIAQAFLLLPLCLSYLGAHLFGAWLGASEWLIWLQLLDIGIPNLLTQRIGAALGNDDRLAAARWSSTGLMLLTGIASVLTTIAIVAAPFVTRWADVEQQDATLFTASFRVGAIASAALLLANGVSGISRGTQVTALMNGAQALGALAGLIASAGLLVAGFGILALPLGLATRALFSLGGAAIFLARARHHQLLSLTRPSTVLIRETFGLGPSMAAASAGYLLANNTEILLVTTLFGPVGATIYTMTRRASDGVRNLLDAVAWAVYGGFAHLVTAQDRHRARPVLHEILWLRLAIACLCGAVVVAVNRPFVTLLFGKENFGGDWLTVLFAAQMVVGGQAFLANYLLRATGRLREGSYLLGAEAVVRLIAMVAGLLTLGLAGAPLAAVIVSAVALAAALWRLDRELPGSNAPSTPISRGILAPVLVFALGCVVMVLGIPIGWRAVFATAAIVTGSGAALLWFTLPPAVQNGSLLRWSRS